MLTIKLPDGNNIQFPNKITGLEVAQKISKSLSKQAMQKNQLEIAATAKKIAAEHGANYLQIISYQPPRSVDPLDGFNMILKAYRL